MNRIHKRFPALNAVTLALMLFMNFAGSTGFFSGKTIAAISYRYDTLFVPANYAFIIWGLIFLLAICFVIFQFFILRKNDSDNFIKKTGWWFAISNIANAAWVYFWLNEMLGWSVITIFLLLLCLVMLTIRLRLELDDKPVRTILFVWWPITFYLGWILVASIACVSAWLVSIGWNHVGLPESTLTIVMIAIGCLLYLVLIGKRNMREASLVGIWAFIAIAIRQWNLHFNIAAAATAASFILTVASIVHAYKNRYYNIPAKLSRGECK